MDSFRKKISAIADRLTRSEWIIMLSFLVLSVLLKLMYIFAAPIWRVDLFYHIQSAKTILDGGVLFRDFGTSHPAGIVFIHWCLMKLFGYTNITISLKIAALLTQTFSAYLFYAMIKKSYSKFLGYGSALIFIVVLTINWQLWPANIMFFYLLPTMAGIYFLNKYAEQQAAFPYFAAGFLFSISTLLCTNTIVYTLLVPVISYYTCRDIKKFMYHSTIGFIGFLIPMAFNFGYFYYHNALSDYYLWNIEWASIYAGYKPFYTRIINVFIGIGKTWEWIPLFMFSFYGLYIIIRKKLYNQSFSSFMAISVFFVSLIARLGMARSPVRYSLYLLPGLLFLLPVAIRYFSALKDSAAKKIIPLVISLFVIVVFSHTYFAAHANSRGFLDYNRKELHQWIKENTKPDESIFVWYEGYEVYFYTGRKMATSIFSTAEFLDHVEVWEANKYRKIDLFWERFINEFKRDKPVVLIDLRPDFNLDNNWHRSGEMERYFEIFKKYLDQNYKPVTVINGVKVWKRNDKDDQQR
jgi:hypothetical protein